MHNILIQCGDHFENQNRILPLVLHLKGRGFFPHVLSYNKSNCSRLFELEGVSVIYIDDFRRDFKLNRKKTINDNAYEDIIKIDKIKFPWNFRSQNLKKERDKVIRDYMILYECIIQKYSIDYIGIWNGYTGYVANILRSISKEYNIRSFYMERSFFDQSLFVDCLGTNGESHISYLDMNGIRQKKFQNFKIPSVYDSDISEKDVSSDLLRSNFDYFIFLPLQVQTDTNNILYSPHVSSMRRLILLVLDAIQSLNDKYSIRICLIVRQHPEEIDTKLNLPKSDSIYYKNSGDIKSWCLFSDLVLTINSTVGVEAIFYKKPVVSLGASLYSGKNITLDTNDTDLYKSIEKSLLFQWTPNSDDVASFFGFLYSYNTCNEHNFPSCLEPYFDGKCSKFISNVNSIYKRWYEKNNRKTLIRVGVYDVFSLKINLTYRKNSISISNEFITNRLITILSLDGHEKIETISLKSLNDFDNIDILIVSENTDVDFLDSNILVLDNYLLPVEKMLNFKQVL